MNSSQSFRSNRSCSFHPGATYGNTIYEVDAPGKKVAWLVEEWSGGASGENGLMLSLIFEKIRSERRKVYRIGNDPG